MEDLEDLDDEAPARAAAVNWARQVKRVQIVTLIREFNSTVGNPSGARRARNILKRTIEALEGAAGLGDEAYATCSVARCVRAEWQVKAAILQQLKALLELWSATQTDAITPEFAHAMDSLLMHEVQFEEYEPTTRASLLQ